MNISDALPVGTRLGCGVKSSYLIDDVIGRGGFGVTYRAHDNNGQSVAIKEFFPRGMCSRDIDTGAVIVDDINQLDIVDKLRHRFVTESRNLALCDNPGIVHIIETFEENGTAYMVMEHVEGVTLKTFVINNGAMSEQLAREIIISVAWSLDYLHFKNITHLDIKPDNIILTGSGQPVIIDFGLSRQYDAQGITESQLVAAVSKGYTAIEQYTPRPIFSPESDVYSLAATMLYLLTGVTPDEPNESSDPTARIPATISTVTRRAISHAMSFSTTTRTRTMQRFINDLNDVRKQSPTPTPPTPRVKSDNVRTRGNNDRQRKNKPSQVVVNTLLTILFIITVLIAVAFCSGEVSRGQYGGNVLPPMRGFEIFCMMSGVSGVLFIALMTRARGFKYFIWTIGFLLTAAVIANIAIV